MCECGCDTEGEDDVTQFAVESAVREASALAVAVRELREHKKHTEVTRLEARARRIAERRPM